MRTTTKRAQGGGLVPSASSESAPALGRRGEERAAAWLTAQGFVVVDRNVRSRRGEVDLVCFEGATLCFVEVRARASLSHGTPGSTVCGRKQRRIAHAARTYLSRFGSDPPPCRFDVVEVHGTSRAGAELSLVRGAFEAAS